MVSAAVYGRSHSWHFTRRSQGIHSPRVSSAAAAGGHRKPSWTSPSISSVAVSFIIASLALAAGCVLYLFLFRSASGRGGLVLSGFVGLSTVNDKDQCDVFEGSWVPAEAGYPLYNSSECPFAERGFNCLANGRKDTGYLKWKWKPRRCEVPPFDARSLLKKLQGKRVVFVGDSMSRTQWESLICMLMSGVDDPRSVYEVNGNEISKTIRFLGVRFGSFNLSVDFYRSVYLIQQGSAPRHGPKRVRSTLRLDRMDDISQKWVDSDVLVFNSGHWWTPGKLFEVGCYFQVGGSLKLGMPITLAFRTALQTWASWVETVVDTNRTHVFFRTFEPSHWSDSSMKVCEVTQQPLSEPNGNERSEFSEIISDVVMKMHAPVSVINVTSMGAFRSDAHIGNWSHPPTLLDCSHWCLPGVPDAWNELLFSYLLYSRGRSSLS